ncbi:MAG: hypothetical protein ACO1SV_13885 [Fimbriimonas sp.]
MTKRRRVLIGMAAFCVLAGTLVVGIGGQSAWDEPPDFLRSVPAQEDRTRVSRLPAGMAPRGPVRVAIRHRIYRFDTSSREFLDRVKPELLAANWTPQSMLGPDKRRTGVLFLRKGTVSPQTIHILVWEAPGGPTTRVEYQELREATVLECGLSDLRRLILRR